MPRFVCSTIACLTVASVLVWRRDYQTPHLVSSRLHANPSTGLPVTLVHEPVEDENNILGKLPASQTVSPARKPEKRLDNLFRDSGMQTLPQEATTARVRCDRLRGHDCIERTWLIRTPDRTARNV